MKTIIIVLVAIAVVMILIFRPAKTISAAAGKCQEGVFKGECKPACSDDEQSLGDELCGECGDLCCAKPFGPSTT